MRRAAVLLLTTMALAILLAGGVAQAIINGEPDTGPNAHPYVGAYVTKFEGELLPVCSGTLISPRVFLTAGHCTELEIEKDRPVYVSFDPTYKPGASALVKGTPYLHPKFCIPTPEDKADYCAPKRRSGPLLVPLARDIRYDVGVVVLNKPVRMATYGALPKVGLVDTLKEGQRLPVVGYGVSRFERGGDGPRPRVVPVLPGDRYRTTVRLLNPIDPAIGDQLVKTSGTRLGGGGEGICYGDSGGPLFLPDQETIVGTTSGVPAVPLCRAQGYYQRMDLPAVLKWVRSFG
jgi:hypothetical protein